MSYDYKETTDEIIIDKGISTREMWKEYEHGKEHVSFEELEQGAKLRPTVPMVLDTQHNHGEPLTDASRSIGAADFTPCPSKRGLKTVWRFLKKKCPDWLLQHLRERKPLPVSMYQFVNVGEDREQRDLLFDHIAILANQDPRCPIERCGVGVYDSKMTEEPKKEEVTAPEPEQPTTSPEVVQTVQEETKEPPPSKVEVTPEPDPVPDKDSIISELKAKLAKREEQLNAIRQPLVDELVSRGYQLQELNTVKLETLQKMAAESRAATTEGLPGTVPAPSATTPKALHEQRADEQKRFEESLKKRQEERFKDW